MKIYAPVKDTNGVRASVRFTNGVGETDNPALIEWFKSHGYKVPIEERPRVERSATIQENVLNTLVEDVEVDAQPNFDAMNPNELRDWMRTNGYGSKIKNTRSKEKLLEILRG